MQNLKIKVNNKAESKEAQELLFEFGASWNYGKEVNENMPHDRAIILHTYGTQLFWANVYESKNYDDAKEITLPELRSMVNKEQDEPLLTPECTLNDQYAEIEQVRQAIKVKSGSDSDHAVDAMAYGLMSGIDATLKQRQSTYGNFEDVAFVTENIMGVLGQVRVNGLSELPNTHRMALYMIASKMARIVNGDFNHLDGWHDIGGYAKLVEDLIKENNNG